MHCTVPSYLKPWFNKHFAEECDWHDLRYVLRDMPKTVADLMVAWKMATKYKWSWWLMLSFVVLVLHPKAYGMWYKDELGIWRW
jgi:hypothetical protein